MRNTTLIFLITIGIWSCKKTEHPPDQANSNTKQYSAEVATGWYNFLTDISRTTPFPPPPSLRLFAYSGLALYESVVPGMPSYRSAYTLFTGKSIPFDGQPRNYYWPAAANAAMARIISKLLADYPNPKLTANLNAVQQLETYYSNQFVAIATNDQLQNSVVFGRLSADSIYSWSKTDGTFNADGSMTACPPYIPLSTPGKWVPTPPGFSPAAGACQGNIRTFISGIVTSVLPPPPPSYSTTPGSEYWNMMNEVYQLKNNATTTDMTNGEMWRDLVGTNYNTPAHMVRLTVNIVNKEKLNLEDASVLFAKEGIALFDAIASAFYSKYYYSIERPITYIRNVMGYTMWEAQYPTIQHPSYASTFTSAASAATTVLENYVGTSYHFIDSTQQTLYGNWEHPSLSHLLDDVARSRIYTGHNFRSATTAGITLGRTVATKILNLPFKKE